MKTTRIFAALTISAGITLLSACASNIPLDEPATSSSSTSNQSTNPSAGGATTGTGSVVSVDTTGTSGATTGKTPPLERSVYFDYDSFIIKDDYKNVIESNVRFINNNLSLIHI